MRGWKTTILKKREPGINNDDRRRETGECE
jgi:hypothetical protein